MVPTFATARTLDGRKPSASVFEDKISGQDRLPKPRLVVNNTKRNAEAARQLAKVLENRENGVFTPW
jgi:hypothetical protein